MGVPFKRCFNSPEMLFQTLLLTYSKLANSSTVVLAPLCYPAGTLSRCAVRLSIPPKHSWAPGLIRERLKKGKCFLKVVVMIGHATLRSVLNGPEMALDFETSSYESSKLG